MAEQVKPKHSLYKICQVLWNLRSDSYIEKREPYNKNPIIRNVLEYYC